MRLEWVRPKSELKKILREPNANGPEVAYWVFSDITDDKWKHMTILTPGLYGKEFPKTFGHYHTPKILETYKLISGEGLFLMQKKHIQNGHWTPEKIDEIYMVKLTPNEEIIVPFEFAHSWTNIGKTPLVLFDDWNVTHVEMDYEAIERLQGMCFYVTNENGLTFEPNKNYKNHPLPRVVSAKEFQKLYPVS